MENTENSIILESALLRNKGHLKYSGILTIFSTPIDAFLSNILVAMAVSASGSSPNSSKGG